MPATATLDHVEGSSVTLFGQTLRRAKRMGLVEGLPNSSLTNAADVLWQAMNAVNMPPTGSSHPSYSDLILQSITITGRTADIASVELSYEQFGNGGGIASILEVSTVPTMIQTNMMPGSKEPFRISHEPTEIPGAGGVIPPSANAYIPPGLVTLGIFQPTTQVTVTQLRNGTQTPLQAISFARGNGCKVNSTDWMGAPAGSWLVSEARSVVSRYDGKLQTTLTALNRDADLWSYWGTLQSELTGKYADGPGMDPARQALLGFPYTSRRILTYSQNGKQQGLIRVDPYDVIPFAPLFGF